MSNTDDDNIKKISKMLEIGGTMLAQHCANCGAPLFRYQGRVLCPVCEDVRDPRASMQSTTNPETRTDAPSPPKTEVSSVKEKKTPVAAVPEATPVKAGTENTAPFVSVPGTGTASTSELESLLVKKMVSLANTMQDETDVRRIGDHLDMIERCVEIINKMKGSL